jgi:hypothetical protein
VRKRISLRLCCLPAAGRLCEKKKISPQIYWVESAYFFPLSAKAEHEEIPQINQLFFLD